MELSTRPLKPYVIILMLLLSTTQSNSNRAIHINSFPMSDNTTITHNFNSSHPNNYSFDDPCETPTSPKYVALASFSAVVVVLGIGGNLMVILVIQYSQLRKQPGYALVTSLAAADIGVSLFVTTSKVQLYQHNRNFCSNLSFCVFHYLTDSLFPIASITHLLLICINKFCAVISPYNYHTLVTHGKEMVVVMCVWVYCLLWTSMGTVTWDQNLSFSIHVVLDPLGINRHCYSHNPWFYVCAAMCVFIVPVLVAGFLYAIVLVVVLEKMQTAPVLSEMEASSSCVADAPAQHHNIPGNFNNTRGAKTLFMVFTSWVVCWMPHFLLILVGHWDPAVLDRLDSYWWYHFVCTLISDVLPCINSCINPFIYFHRSSIFRHAFRDSYLKLMKRPRHRAGSQTNLAIGGTWKSPSLDTVVRYGVCAENVIFVPPRPNF